MIFVRDDWAEDHHDVNLMDETGARLASRRVLEGLSGIGEFHELAAVSGQWCITPVIYEMRTGRGEGQAAARTRDNAEQSRHEIFDAT
jgi:hypothetical protein